MNPLLRVLAAVAALLCAGCAELSRAPDGGFEFELTGRFAARSPERRGQSPAAAPARSAARRARG